MLKQLHGGLLTALAIVACAASTARAGDKDDIKASGQAFAKAVQEGDVQEAHKYAITDDASSKFLDVLVSLTKARKNMTDAAVAKFGEPGKSVFAGRTNLSANGPDEIAKRMDSADIEIQGDTATVTPKNPAPGQRGQSAQPMVFKKEDGTWKLDFTKFPNKDRMPQELPMMEKMSSAMNETADEIKSGKYATVQEARSGFIQKVRAAIGGPAGRPGASGGER